MELSYLEELVVILERLEQSDFPEDTVEHNDICQEIEKHIGRFDQFVVKLKEYKGKYGCYNYQTSQVIDEAERIMLQRFAGPNGAFWSRFANGKCLSELKRWIKEESRSQPAEDTETTAAHSFSKADLPNGKPVETEQKAEGSKIMITVRTSKENWEAIKSEYGISKMGFGKKINFVQELFKRKVIFRDVEHAFVLASQGFSKPAIILAGGVIEELLRLYLKHKKIPSKGKMFVDYIKACEDNGLLKRGVYSLTDSIRDFRNLVHLDNEKTERHTISKSTAKGAVSSIFTIADAFQ